MCVLLHDPINPLLLFLSLCLFLSDFYKFCLYFCFFPFLYFYFFFFCLFHFSNFFNAHNTNTYTHNTNTYTHTQHTHTHTQHTHIHTAELSLVRIALFVAGLSTIALSSTAAHNLTVYYSISSILMLGVLVFILLKFIERRMPMNALNFSLLATVTGGVIATWSADAVQAMLQSYWAWLGTTTLLGLDGQVFVYLMAVLLVVVSVAVAYWMGPPRENTLTILSASLVLVGGVLIVLSMEDRPLACALWLAAVIVIKLGTHPYVRAVLLGITWVLHPLVWTVGKVLTLLVSPLVAPLKPIYRKFFGPRPRKLLSMEEYEREGTEYTRIKLQELQQQMHSMPTPSFARTVQRLHPGSRSRVNKFAASDQPDGHLQKLLDRSLFQDEDVGRSRYGNDDDDDDDGGKDSNAEISLDDSDADDRRPAYSDSDDGDDGDNDGNKASPALARSRSARNTPASVRQRNGTSSSSSLSSSASRGGSAARRRSPSPVWF